jgi:hypothetical protein
MFLESESAGLRQALPTAWFNRYVDTPDVTKISYLRANKQLILHIKLDVRVVGFRTDEYAVI